MKRGLHFLNVCSAASCRHKNVTNMTERETFDWVYLLLLYPVLIWAGVRQIRYMLRRHRSQVWPTTEALIQKGTIGSIHFGKGATAPASFTGYAYSIENVRYAGYFALYGDEATMRRLHESLVGTTIQIRYDPSDPNISCLVNCYDPRFVGVTVTQNPEWLDQAPAFDLQDALCGATVSKNRQSQ